MAVQRTAAFRQRSTLAVARQNVGEAQAVPGLSRMKFLLTGAQGQLGRALQDQFSTRSKDSVCAFSHAELEITNLENVRRAVADVRPDAVINAAAYNLVEQAELDPTAAFAGNET